MKKKLLIILSLISLLLVSISLWIYKPHKLHFRTTSFSHLPGWKTANTKQSFIAFQTSCRAFLKQDPEKTVGSDYFDLQAKDWYPACNAALKVNTQSNLETKVFFQNWFIPVEFYNNTRVRGLFTGYYMPLLRGSLTKTEKFNVPLYGLPKQLVTANLELFDPKLKHRKIVGRVHDQK